MTKYLHTMIRVTDPDATIAFFKLIGLEEVKRVDVAEARFTLIFLAAPGQAGIAEVELGRKPIKCTIEAPKWRTYRAESRARKAGCLSKRLSVRDGSHLGVPVGFGPNAPLRRPKGLKY